MHTITLPNQRERKKGFKSVRAEGKERGRKLEGEKKPKDEFLFHPFLEKVEFSPTITRRGLV